MANANKATVGTGSVMMDLRGDDEGDWGGGEDGDGIEEIDDDDDDNHANMSKTSRPTPVKPNHSRDGPGGNSRQGREKGHGDVDSSVPEAGTVNQRRVVLIEDPPHLASGSASLSSIHNAKGDWSSSSSSSSGESSMSLAHMLCSFRDPVILIIRFLSHPLIPSLPHTISL